MTENKIIFTMLSYFYGARYWQKICAAVCCLYLGFEC